MLSVGTSLAPEQSIMTEQTSSDWLGLSGRVCVVTGGGGGIGRAVALSLARAGARVAAIDLDERGLEATRTELLEHIQRPCRRRAAIRRAPTALPPRPRQSKNRSDPAACWSTPRRCCGPAGSKTCRWPNGTRCCAVNLTGYFLCAQTFGRPDAQRRARQPRSCVLDRRQPCAGPQRRLQRQQGRRHHAVAPARERMGTAGHPQQRRQPRHGDHADEPVVLRYARA